MRIKWHRLLMLLVVAMLAIAAAGCGGDDDEEAGGTGGATTEASGGAEGGTLVFAGAADPVVLDGALVSDGESIRAITQMFETLVALKPGTTEPEPGLATEWEANEAGTTWTFQIREGVTFHDGEPLNAEAVCANFDRWYNFEGPLQNPSASYYWQVVFGGFAKFDEASGAPEDSLYESCEATDEFTVDLNLTKPSATLIPALSQQAFSIASPKALEEFQADAGTLDADGVFRPEGTFGTEHPIGTGPWKFVEWRHDDYLRFARNEDYFDGPPKADSLMARIIPEPSTAVAEFESGNVDVLYVPEGETRNWEQTDEKKAMLESAPALRVFYIAINTTRGPLADKRVRQALNYATDARAILEGIVSGRGNLAAGVIPPSLPGGDSTRQGYTRDVARAKRLLAEAGFANGIDVELWSSQTPPFPRIAQAVQANLKDAGVRVTLVQRDASSMREAARAGQTDMALKDWFADYPDAENFLFPLLHSTNKGVGGNVSFYSNAQFDKLVSDSHREQDEAARIALYRQADQLAFEDAPMIYLFFYKELYAVQPWIRNFKVPTIFTGQRWTDVQIIRP